MEENENKEPLAGGVSTENPPANPPAETETPPADGESKVTARETFTKTIREYAPDADYDNDEDAIYAKGNELIESLRSKGKQMEDFVAKLTSRFNQNPEEAAAFLDYADGMPLVASIRKNLGDEALSMKEGDEGWDEYVKAGEERTARQKELSAIMDEILENSKKSEEALAKFAKDNNMSDEEREALWNYIKADLENVNKGNYTEDLFGKYKRAMDYDADTKAAAEHGRAEGRNEAIDAQERKMQGSGLPHANSEGAAEEAKEQPNKRNKTADWLDGFKRK